MYNVKYQCVTLCVYTGSETLDLESEQWTDLIDRGGLIHISDTVFELFVAMERELRRHLNVKSASETKGIRDSAVEGIINNEDVKLHWSLISVNWVENEMLLNIIVNHWVTIRGFSFTGAFMEKYKQKHKKTVQKTKGLRKTLSNNKVDHNDNA